MGQQSRMPILVKPSMSQSFLLLAGSWTWIFAIAQNVALSNQGNRIPVVFRKREEYHFAARQSSKGGA
jgi:hypothetical protein